VYRNPAALINREWIGGDVLSNEVQPALSGGEIDGDAEPVRAGGFFRNLMKEVIDNS
jgi:hypothetical protein